jgi:hypothetical protein
MSIEISYDEFEEQWLSDITESNLSSVEKGRNFALKLISQWLDFSEDTDDIFYCDGCSDGGIDIAYLQRDEDENGNTHSGHSWYVVQSKYGTSFSGKETLLIEAQKAIDTLMGRNTHLSFVSLDVVKRISEFRKNISENDHLIFVIATCKELTNDEKSTLDDIRIIGQNALGSIFDVESVCINTIYNRIRETLPEKHKFPINAELVTSGDDLLVGSVKIIDLYYFLREYKKLTNDLDMIYEKNVRKFLGNKKKVNKEIHNTLDKYPERFGLYNNGITIVVENFEKDLYVDNQYKLIEPFIVNGCQTTKTIWEVIDPKLNSGGTGVGSYDDWRIRLEKGIVVVKIVKVGENGEELLTDTTRFTNSQNAVAPRDFLSLDKNFQNWKKSFEEEYNIYLEIQRGGWEAQKALERININKKPIPTLARAFDLLKIYGAGWMGNPGLSYGKNPPFAPGGTVFKMIISYDYNFTKDDLYAAYLINTLTDKVKFGRGATKQSRGQTKFLFVFVIIELLKYCMDNVPIERTKANVSKAVKQVFSNLECEAAKSLTDSALTVIDDYMSQTTDECLFKEKTYIGDLNAFLKNENLGKKEFSTLLIEAITIMKKTIKKTGDLKIIDDVIQD